MNGNKRDIGMNGEGALFDCTQVDSLLRAFYDNELPEAQRRRVARHLETCETCGKTLDAYRELSAIFAAPLTRSQPAPWEELAAKLPLATARMPISELRTCWEETATKPSSRKTSPLCRVGLRLPEEVPPLLWETLHTEGP